jgi:hypothetical protein
VLYVGFYDGARRFEIKRGEHDSERRALGARIPVSFTAAPVPGSGPAPARKAHRRRQARRSRLKAAQDSGPLVQTFTGGPGAFNAHVRVLYDPSASTSRSRSTTTT